MAPKLVSVRTKDAIAAAAVAALGVFGMIEATSYRMGELRNIGPGTFPLIVSAMILAAGILIGLESLAPVADEDEGVQDRPNWRALLFVTTGLLSFTLIAPLFGAVPGIFACVYLAAWADGTLSFWRVGILAAGISAFCAFVFVHLLNLPLDLVEW